MNSLKRVILIVGTPCVGKTSVSRLLAEKLNAVHINIAELVIKKHLNSGVDKIRDTLIADMKLVSEHVEDIIKKVKCDVIVDGYYAMDVVPPDRIHQLFVLRRHPAELKRFMQNRGFKNRKLWENLAAEILDVCLADALSVCNREKVCEIDATGKRPEEVVEEILMVLEGKCKCVVGVVDWLGELETEGCLDEFLKNF